MKIGLRIDVDTFRGTRDGVPSLLSTLKDFDILASFFFSAGPDNMGRHLWRLLKPAFFWKMLRSNAPGLYGWDILLRGTFWPGPMIAEKNASVIKACESAGHEIGVHTWDHQYWQSHIDRMMPEQIRRNFVKACQTLAEIIGRQPECSAAPGWKCKNDVLLENDNFNFRYNSDCLGTEIFLPMVNGKILKTPQIPRTLPTYDEMIGANGVTQGNYNDRLLEMIKPDKLNVLTIHAEVEGGICRDMFVDFLSKAKKRGMEFCPLGQLLPGNFSSLPSKSIVARTFSGREGWMACADGESEDFLGEK